MMKEAKRRKLSESGWKVGSAVDFLRLSQAEAELIEMRVALGRSLVSFVLAAVLLRRKPLRA